MTASDRASRPPASGPQPEPSLARAALDRRRRRDAALALPALAVVLLASPLLDVVAGPGRVFGAPLGAAFTFGAWFALIAATAWLSRRLGRDAGAE